MSVAQILPDDVIVFAPLKTRHKDSNFSKRFARLAAAESLSENSLQIKSDKKKISKTRSQNSLSSTKDQVVITNGVIPSGFTPKEYRVSLGTLTALINHLTSDCDVDFRTTFLMTYRKFTTAEFLMTALRNRFNSESGSEITKVHLRVLGTLKAWIENHWRNDFQLNDSLQVLLQEFVNDLNGPIWGARAKQLQNIIQRKIDPKPRHFAVDNPPDIISPRCDLQSNLKFISLGCLSPIEVARQLAIYSFRIYEQIQAPELLDLAWTKEDKQDLAPNVVEIIKFSDKLSKFSMQNIVMHKSVSDRTTALGWFIVLTEELFKLNDINSSYAVYQALQSAPVMQLQRSWKELGDAHTTRWKQLVHTLQPDKNFKNLRHHVLQCSPPMLPLMELYLKDLTEIEGENITRFENGLINVEKCTKVSNVIQYLQQYQEIGYSLYYQEILVFKKWIDSWKFVEEATLVRRANIVEPETVDWNTYDTMLDFYFQVDTSLDHPPESIPSEESGHSSPKPKLSRKKVLKIKKKKSQSNK